MKIELKEYTKPELKVLDVAETESGKTTRNRGEGRFRARNPTLS
jgi:hypothetical protein